MMVQARAVAAKNAEKMAKEKSVRSLWVGRCVALRRMSWDVKFTDDDFADDRFALAFANGYLSACAKIGKSGLPDQKMYADFKREWPYVPTREAEVEKLHREIRRLSAPAEHRFELVPGGQKGAGK